MQRYFFSLTFFIFLYDKYASRSHISYFIILLHFAYEISLIFVKIIILSFLVRAVRGSPNGVNVPHHHPRLTCAGMSRFLTHGLDTLALHIHYTYIRAYAYVLQKVRSIHRTWTGLQNHCKLLFYDLKQFLQ